MNGLHRTWTWHGDVGTMRPFFYFSRSGVGSRVSAPKEGLVCLPSASGRGIESTLGFVKSKSCKAKCVVLHASRSGVHCRVGMLHLLNPLECVGNKNCHSVGKVGRKCCLRRTVPMSECGLKSGKRNVACSALEDTSSGIDIELEIFEFMQNSEDPGSFPTRQQLINAGRQDLLDAILKEGGWLTIGWEDAEEQDSSSTSYNNTSIEVAGMISPSSYADLRSKQNLAYEMQSGRESDVTGKQDKSKESRMEKSSEGVQLENDFLTDDDNLPPDSPNPGIRRRRKPRGYWKNDDNLKKEIEQFLSTNDRISSKKLKETGHQDLDNAIKRRGGWRAVADLFNMASATFKGVSRSARAVRRRDRGGFQGTSEPLSSGKTGSKAEEAPVIDQWNRSKRNQPNQAIDFAKSTNFLRNWEDNNGSNSTLDSNYTGVRRRVQRRRKDDSSETPGTSSILDTSSESEKKDSLQTRSILRSPNSPASAAPAKSAEEDKIQIQEEEILSSDKDRLLMKKLPEDTKMVLDRIRALESSLSATREALQSGRNSLIDEGRKIRESTIAEIAKVTDSLEFRESEIMKTRVELRNTKAKVSALEGRLATEFSETMRELSEKQERIEEIESVLYQMRTVKVVFPNPAQEVLLAGSFDGWNNRVKMVRSTAGVFVANLQLYPGRYEIKFIVDGIWRVDPGRQIVYTDDGSENNLLYVA